MVRENRYFVSERPAAANHAGNKARIDVENILSSMDFQPMVHVEFCGKFVKE